MLDVCFRLSARSQMIDVGVKENCHNDGPIIGYAGSWYTEMRY